MFWTSRGPARFHETQWLGQLTFLSLLMLPWRWEASLQVPSLFCLFPPTMLLILMWIDWILQKQKANKIPLDLWLDWGPLSAALSPLVKENKIAERESWYTTRCSVVSRMLSNVFRHTLCYPELLGEREGKKPKSYQSIKPWGRRDEFGGKNAKLSIQNWRSLDIFLMGRLDNEWGNAQPL